MASAGPQPFRPAQSRHSKARREARTASHLCSFWKLEFLAFWRSGSSLCGR